MNKIVPWIYKKDEEAELYWLCSPYLSKNNNWIITAVFKRNNELKMVELPWGTLPLLRLGQRYINGVPAEGNPRGYVGQLKIENEEFQICESFKMPPRLYYFYKKPTLGNEFVCKVTIGYKDYYIPCIEIVRSFIAKSKTLANYLLKPNGLDFLIDKTEIIDQDINIFLSSEVPRDLISDDSVAHLLWMKYNTSAHSTWTSIYNNIFSKALEEQPEGTVNQFFRGSRIEAIPPINKNCTWTYRGIYSGNSVLILELLSTTGFELPPFKEIRYFHPSFDRTKAIDKNGVIRRINKGKEDIYEIPLDKANSDTKKDNNQPVIELSHTEFVYDGELNIRRLKGKERLTNNGITVVKAKADENAAKPSNSLIASPQDWSAEGKIPSIEFNSLELVKGKLGKGLEEFYKAIEYMRNNYKWLYISMSEVFLPKGKSFSYYPDGSRRNCTIVRISSQKSEPCYILEVGRADEWSISTLVIYFNRRFENRFKLEYFIANVLKILVKNKGHWDSEYLKAQIDYKIIRFKHTRQNTYLKLLSAIVLNNI